jgi:Na+-transporting methylmalonyl-CoA/oxaloacetate decarboxylase gamma subunit
MEIDWTWTQAGQISGISLGSVFATMAILALATWLIGLVIRRIEGRGSKAAAGSKKTSSTQ